MSKPLGFAFSSLTGVAPSRLVSLAAEAERRGYSALVLTESYNDVMPLAAAVAGATRRATVATAIANVGFRHPALIALGTAGVDELSGGRFVLGLGIGTQWFDRAGRGEAAERPLAALEEYVALVRRLLGAGTGTVRAEGAFYRLDDFHLDSVPLRPRVPIYLAAMGPGMLRLAGRIADGVFLGLSPLEVVPRMIATVREAAVTAGRDPANVHIAMQVRACVDDDAGRARDGIRASVPMYLAFPGYARHFRALGYGAVVEAVRAALERGDRAGAAAEIPDELVDRVSVYGSAERCREGLERFRAAGVELPIVSARAAERAREPRPYRATSRRSGQTAWDATLQRAIAAFAPGS